MERPDAVLFDLDGTIIDSRVAFSDSMNYALAAYGRAQRAPEELWPYLGPPTHETFKQLLGDGDEQLINQAVVTYRAHYARHSAATTKVYAGIRELLGQLHGQVPLAVATSKVAPAAVALLEGLGLAEIFDAICGPQPEAVNESKAVTVGHALTALHQPGRAVMIGDRFYDVVGAREHGIPTIGVLWGSGTADELREARADWIVATPDEIPPILGL
jgi:phosphoglycolate phosphatase